MKITLTKIPVNDRVLVEDMNLALGKAMATFTHEGKAQIRICACLLQAAHQAAKKEWQGSGAMSKEDFLELADALYDNASAQAKPQISKTLANPDTTETES